MPPRSLQHMYCWHRNLQYKGGYAPENQVKSGLLLNIIVIQSTAVLKLFFSSENESLLVRRDTAYETFLSASVRQNPDTKNDTPFLLS